MGTVCKILFYYVFITLTFVDYIRFYEILSFKKDLVSAEVDICTQYCSTSVYMYISVIFFDFTMMRSYLIFFV